MSNIESNNYSVKKRGINLFVKKENEIYLFFNIKFQLRSTSYDKTFMQNLYKLKHEIS